MQNTVILVLGSHRSGTSALAGTLAALGAKAPAHMLLPSKVNERGFWESAAILRLHDALFSCVRTCWDDWRPFPGERLSPAQREGFIARAVQVLTEEFGDATLSVLKDPRICRFVPLWLEVLARWQRQVAVLLVHRHPLEVAESLARRDGMQTEVALRLWLRHVLEAEAASRDLPRAFVSYAGLLGDWRATLATASAALATEHWLDGSIWTGADPRGQKVDDFLSASLRHVPPARAPSGEAGELIGAALIVFDIFERWAKVGAQVGDYPALDRLHHWLNRVLPT